MSESKFTPGPWEARSDCAGEIYVFAGGRIYEDTTQPRTGMSEANASLIAAAPDMYEALKALVEGIDEYDGFVALGDMVAARIALAKAEGAI